MKTTKRLFSILGISVLGLALVFAFLASCNLGLSDPAESDATRDVGAKVKVSANITNYFEVDGHPLNEEGVARTIMPNPDQRGYDYYIYAVSVNDVRKGDKNPEKISLSEDTKTGTSTNIEYYENKVNFTYEIEPSVWDFTLYALDPNKEDYVPPTDVTENFILNEAVLVAYAHADLVRSNAPVNFTLSPDGLLGTANVKLNLFTTNSANYTDTDEPSNSTTAEAERWFIDENVDKIVAEVRDLLTGEVIQSGEKRVVDRKPVQRVLYEKNKPATHTGFRKDGEAGATGALYADASAGWKDVFGGYVIDPGTYNFVVTFTRTNPHTNETVDFVWSDVLLVITNRKEYKDVYIPDIIGKVPDAPTNAAATYEKNSEDMPAYQDSYVVVFTWKDQANNETFFELQLADMTGKSEAEKRHFNDDREWYGNGYAGYEYGLLPENPDDETQKSTVIAYADGKKDKQLDSYNKEYKYKSFFSSDERYTGSLLANNQEVSFVLPLGRSYQARIRAVNNLGVSDWAEFKLYETNVASPQDEISGKVTYSAVKLTNEPQFFNSCYINRYRITYKLNGGFYQEVLGTKFYDDVIKYHIVEHPVDNGVSTTPTTLWNTKVLPNTATGYNVNAGDDLKNRYLQQGKNAIPTDDDTKESDNLPFCYWVLDVNKFDQYRNQNNNDAAIKEKRTIVYDAAMKDPDEVHPENTERYIKANGTSVEPDNYAQEFKDGDLTATASAGGYIGYDNVTLYAEYVRAMDANVAFYDPVWYKLLPEWINYEISTSGEPLKEALKHGITELIIGKDYDPTTTTVRFSVKIPADVLPSMYDTITMEVIDKDGVTKLKETLDVSDADPAEDNLFVFTQNLNFIDYNYNRGEAYKVNFTAKKAKPNTTPGATIIRTVPVIMKILDKAPDESTGSIDAVIW